MDFNKQDLQENVGEAEEDRISELPDSILHYILSFLATEYVARTCVLSKRWKHLWTSIPVLDFQFWDLLGSPSLSEINKFMDFVDRTLLLHHPSNVQKFTLGLYKNMNASRVHSWIENLTSRHVEELGLYLHFDQDIPLSIPVSLFTCESLTKLELSDGPSVQFPENIFFPKLRSLTLSRIQFGGNNGCWNEQPFSNCVVLEELILENCTWFDMRQFYISTPVLEVLEIINEFEYEGTLEDCDLKIRAPSLVTLKCQGYVAKDYDISNFPTLDTAEVEFFIFDDESGRGEQKITQAVSKCVRALSHVRCLSLYVESEPVLFIADDFVSNLPAFHNLKELKLHRGAATTDKLIFGLLTATPNLKCLELGWFDDSCDEEKEYDETKDLFRHLQSVRFVGFSGRRRELRWVKLILKNAKSLQTMTIRRSYDMAKNKEVVISELPSLPRASERCLFKVV